MSRRRATWEADRMPPSVDREIALEDAHVLADNRRALALLSRVTEIEECRRVGPAIILLLTRLQR